MMANTTPLYYFTADADLQILNSIIRHIGAIDLAPSMKFFREPFPLEVKLVFV